MRRIIIICLFLAFPGVVFAEISPDSYIWLQENAPEALFIKVNTVKRPLISLTRNPLIQIKATILEVIYTETDLEVGDSIEISYHHHNPRSGWVGPRPIPILEKGRDYPAYLIYDGESGSYIPAAKGYSFTIIRY